MSFKPLSDRLLVRPAQHSGVSKGGIYLPTEEVPCEGVVEAVGPGRTLDNGTLLPLGVEVGNTVVFSKRAGIELKLNEEKFLVLQLGEVLGIKDSQ